MADDVEADVVIRRRWWWTGWWLWLAVSLAGADLVRPDLDGREQRVTDYLGRGQWTVVVAWSVDCGICRRELHHMAFFHDAHKQRDARVLGWSVDGAGERARVAAFVDEQGLGFPNLIGERGDIALLGATPLKGTPTYLLFNPAGDLVAERLGAMTQEDVERLIARAKKTARQ